MPRLNHQAKQALIQERQQQILQAAAQVFAEKGFDAATIRDIARAAGVAEGSIYLYFKNKQDLLVHLPRQFIQPPVDSFRAAAISGATPPPPEILFDFIAQNIVNVVTHNRELVRVLFTSLPTMDDATRATYMREGPGYAIEMIETYIRKQQAAGVFRAELDPEIAARIMPGMFLFFLLVQEILQPSDLPRFDYTQVIPTAIRIYLHGVMDERATKTRKKKGMRARTKSTPHTRKASKHKIAIE